MAKKNKDLVIPDEIKDVFKGLDKDNEDSSWLSENSLSVVDKWTDTGSMALNAIMSGSLYKGVPLGRIVGFSGPSMCGKTLMMMRIIANAQKQGMIAVIFDSEMAFDKDMAVRLGCDASKIKVYPVESIAQCRNQVVKFLLSVIEKNLQEKFIICIDSLGNLASTKELQDALKGKDAVDMGTRGKECLDGETIVLMDNGCYKKIKDIKKGERVQTHLKRIKEIEDCWPIKHKKIYKFKIDQNNIIKTSENHKLLIKRDGVLQFMMAKYIKKTDKLIKIKS